MKGFRIVLRRVNNALFIRHLRIGEVIFILVFHGVVVRFVIFLGIALITFYCLEELPGFNFVFLYRSMRTVWVTFWTVCRDVCMNQ